jgi:hypothetical protein
LTFNFGENSKTKNAYLATIKEISANLFPIARRVNVKKIQRDWRLFLDMCFNHRYDKV